MARGAASKEIITNKLLETFNDSFVNGKEIRIPMSENGEIVQIKITLTCAKDNIPSPNEDTTIDGVIDMPTSSLDKDEKLENYMIEPTEEEKANVANLVEFLGLAE